MGNNNIFNSKKKEFQSIIICIKCKKLIPKIILNKSNLNILCKCVKNKYFVSIDNYLNQIQNNNKEQKYNNFLNNFYDYCFIHKNIIKSKFCLNCEKIVCNFCIKDDLIEEKHNIIDIEKYCENIINNLHYKNVINLINVIKTNKINLNNFDNKLIILLEIALENYFFYINKYFYCFNIVQLINEIDNYFYENIEKMKYNKNLIEIHKKNLNNNIKISKKNSNFLYKIKYSNNSIQFKNYKKININFDKYKIIQILNLNKNSYLILLKQYNNENYNYLNIYNFENMKLINNIILENKFINKIFLYKNPILILSAINNIFIYNINENSIIYTINKNENDLINIISVNEKDFIIFYSNKKLNIFDMNFYKIIKIINIEENNIKNFLYSFNYNIIIYSNDFINLYNLNFNYNNKLTKIKENEIKNLFLFNNDNEILIESYLFLFVYDYLKNTTKNKIYIENRIMKIIQNENTFFILFDNDLISIINNKFSSNKLISNLKIEIPNKNINCFYYDKYNKNLLYFYKNCFYIYK